MKTLHLRRYTVSACAAVALLAACGGAQPPIGAPGTMPQSRAVATHAERGGSWMLPAAKSEDLLYISSGDDRTVHVFSYPGGKTEGRLTGFEIPEGMCVDRSGDIFIPDGLTGLIWKYAHGATKPSLVFSDFPYTSPIPVDCSIDPVTGNLAVANVNAASIAVFELGTPFGARLYSGVQFSPFACGYDNAGNLFIAGANYDRSPVTVLRKGSSNFTRLAFRKLPYRIYSSVGIKWDGKYVAIDDQDRSVIYQVRVRGSVATVVGSTTLTDGYRTGEFSFQKPMLGKGQQGKELIGTTADAGAKLWKYPAGGMSTRTISVGDALGVAVSPAQEEK